VSLNLRKTGGNALSILTSDAMNRATSFVLYAMVARHLGAHEFGQLSLALTLFYIFQVLAVAGLKTLTIRQVTIDRSQTGRYFTTGCAIATFSSLSSLVLLFGFVRLMHYPTDTALVILLLCLGLLPNAISAICDGIFQAWERMHPCPFEVAQGEGDKDACTPEAADCFGGRRSLQYLHRPEINDERCSLSFPK